MLDADSNAIPLRAAHRNLGKRFFELKYPGVEEPWSDELKSVLHMIPRHDTGPSLGDGRTMRPEFTMVTQDESVGRAFYDLGDVFQITKPGRYTVKLQFQVYVRVWKGGQIFAYKLVRFEPIEFMIRK